jgi:hypothetical protein
MSDVSIDENERYAIVELSQFAEELSVPHSLRYGNNFPDNKHKQSRSVLML